MNLKKIDPHLLNEVEILGEKKKSNCLIVGENFCELQNFLDRSGIKPIQSYNFIKTFLCQISKEEIIRLSHANCVSFISSLSAATSLMYVSKKILNTNQSATFGEGVGIAFIDTGLCPHIDFLIGKNRVEFFKDFINNHHQMYDDNGHGTFVCGVCCGSGCLSKFEYSGIAPRSSIYALKALNADGEANANKILDAMEWVYDNHKKMGINIVCMSFGSEPLGNNDPIMLGANALWQDGVIVIAAAGNSGPEYQSIKSPGISTKIITVGGLDDNRIDSHTYDPNFFEIANFSSRGPAFRHTKPDVVAPSVDIVSCGTTSAYTTLSGTSVAAPMIAGLCALLLEQQPYWTPNKIKNQLINLCQPLGFEMNLEGFGLPRFGKKT